MSGRRGLAALLALTTLLAWTPGAAAHQRSESFSQWRYGDGQVSLRFTVAAREVSRLTAAGGLDPLPRVLSRYLQDRVEVGPEGRGCEPGAGFRPAAARRGYVVVERNWRCEKPPGWIAVSGFFDVAAEHTHFATWQNGGVVSQSVLTSHHSRWELPAIEASGQGADVVGLGEFLLHGARHILGGLDHVLFLLALLAVCRGAREIVWAVSGFTLGHSLTLGLAVTGYLQPDIRAVESVIGLTVLLFAVERLAAGALRPLPVAVACGAALALLLPLSHLLAGPAPGLLLALALFAFCYLLLAERIGAAGPVRLLVTTLFGLVHGLGFASGFPVPADGTAGLLLPLLAFNLGVELGQLALVALVLGGGLLLRRQPAWRSWSADAVAAGAAAMGVFWFLQRSLA